jgi:hypothetical protein
VFLGVQKNKKVPHNKKKKTRRRKNSHENHTNKKALSSPRLARISFIEKKSRALLRRKRLLTTDTIEHKAVTTQQPQEEGFVCFDDV